MRNAALGCGALLAILAGGYCLDMWKAGHPSGEMDAFRMLFFVGVLCGMISLLIQARIYEPPLQEGDDSRPFYQRLLLPVRDLNSWDLT